MNLKLFKNFKVLSIKILFKCWINGKWEAFYGIESNKGVNKNRSELSLLLQSKRLCKQSADKLQINNML